MSYTHEEELNDERYLVIIHEVLPILKKWSQV